VSASLALHSAADVATLRRQLRPTLSALGFTPFELTRILTVASELARNAVVHGGGGHAHIAWTDDEVRLTFLDRGPGIPDTQRALENGYSTGGGLGVGLGGAMRLANDFRVDGAREGGGTEVQVAFWRRS